jgi:hypothetical protein
MYSVHGNMGLDYMGPCLQLGMSSWIKNSIIVWTYRKLIKNRQYEMHKFATTKIITQLNRSFVLKGHILFVQI